jgi:hypothetical protein
MNTVAVREDQIVYAEFDGVQNRAVLTASLEQIRQIVDERHRDGKRCLIYAKIQENFSVDIQTRFFAVQWLRSTEFDRMAILPSSETFARVINFVLSAADQTERIQIFLNEKTALSWLTR